MNDRSTNAISKVHSVSIIKYSSQFKFLLDLDPHNRAGGCFHFYTYNYLVYMISDL